MTPKRIQRKRTKGWKMPPNTIYVGRPTKWGNPFRVGFSYKLSEDGDRINVRTNEEAANLYRHWLIHYNSENVHYHIKNNLKGKNLACWCKEGEACHADVLLEIANK